jgi:hypothetical protein
MVWMSSSASSLTGEKDHVPRIGLTFRSRTTATPMPVVTVTRHACALPLSRVSKNEHLAVMELLRMLWFRGKLAQLEDAARARFTSKKVLAHSPLARV